MGVGVNTFASMHLTSSLFVAVLATAGFLTQKVQGKPNVRSTDPPCTREVNVVNFPELNGRYVLRDGSHVTDGHGLYESPAHSTACGGWIQLCLVELTMVNLPTGGLVVATVLVWAGGTSWGYRVHCAPMMGARDSGLVVCLGGQGQMGLAP